MWSASVRLAEYISTRTHLVAGKRVLELGAGCHGLVSIVCQRLGASSVTATDLPALMPSLRDSLDENGAHGVACAGRDWLHYDRQDSTKFDVIVAGECLYNVALVQPFFDTYRKCSHADTQLLLCGIIGDDVYAHFTRVTTAMQLNIKTLSNDTSLLRSVYCVTCDARPTHDDPRPVVALTDV